MPNAVGPVRKLSFDNTDIKLTNDNEINFWPGGWVNTEAMDDIKGKTRKTEYRGGILSGITKRCAAEGSLKALFDLIYKTTQGDVDLVVTMANGDQWSGACFATVDPESFFNNQDGKASFDIHPSSGEFSAI